MRTRNVLNNKWANLSYIAGHQARIPINELNIVPAFMELSSWVGEDWMSNIGTEPSGYCGFFHSSY